MTLPNDFVLVRHGQSEANIVQKDPRYANGRPAAFETRHDSNMRLSPLGVEQAEATGEWLRNNHLGGFDAYFVSPHTRAMETAAHLKLGGNWVIDDLLRERDWGEYGAAYSKIEQEQKYPDSSKIKRLNSWYWKPVGGESLATGVRARFNMLFNRMSQMENVDKFIGVAHGEFIAVARFDLERMTPSEWIEMDKNPEFTIRNGMVVHFTRVDPETGYVSHRYKWRRMVCPWDESQSPLGGRWHTIDTHKFSDEDLLRKVEEHPRLIND